MITPMQLISIAQGWLGVPYLHQGRSRFGADCIGYVYCVIKEAGILPPEVGVIPADYTRRVQNDELLRNVMKHCREVKTPVDGCMILFRWAKDPHPTHVGLYYQGSMLHCYSRAGGVVRHGFRSFWTRWAHSYWLLPGVSYE